LVEDAIYEKKKEATLREGDLNIGGHIIKVTQ